MQNFRNYDSALVKIFLQLVSLGRIVIVYDFVVKDIEPKIDSRKEKTDVKSSFIAARAV